MPAQSLLKGCVEQAIGSGCRLARKRRMTKEKGHPFSGGIRSARTLGIASPLQMRHSLSDACSRRILQGCRFATSQTERPRYRAERVETGR